jgi:hypothetical protein
MQTVVALLFRVAFAPLVRVCAAALAPVFANLALDKVQIKDLVIKVGEVMQGKTVVFSAMGIYSDIEQKEIVEGTADMLKAVLVEFQLDQSTLDIGKLLSAVADKMAV